MPKNPGVYSYQFHGTEIIYKFNTLVVKDQNEAALLASKNPFALVILACLYNLNTNEQTNEALQLRLQYKKKLAKLCYQRNYSKQEIINLLTFVAYAVSLPEFLDNEFEESIVKLTIENNMTLYEQNPSMLEAIWSSVSKTPIHEILRRMRAEAKLSAEAEVRAELEAKIAKVKAEVDAKVKAEVDAKVKAEVDAKVKAETKAKEDQNINLLTKAVLKFQKFGLTPKEIAEELEVDLKRVNKILRSKK